MSKKLTQKITALLIVISMVIQCIPFTASMVEAAIEPVTTQRIEYYGRIVDSGPTYGKQLLIDLYVYGDEFIGVETTIGGQSDKLELSRVLTNNPSILVYETHCWQWGADTSYFDGEDTYTYGRLTSAATTFYDGGDYTYNGKDYNMVTMAWSQGTGTPPSFFASKYIDKRLDAKTIKRHVGTTSFNIINDEDAEDFDPSWVTVIPHNATIGCTSPTGAYLEASDGDLNTQYHLDGSALIFSGVLEPKGADENALLSDIKVDGTSVADFESTTKSYTVNVANATSSVTITPTADSGELTEIKVNGTEVVSGATSGAITLELDPELNTTITITTTAEDGTTTDSYTVVIHRKSVNADLSDLKIDGTTVAGFTSGNTTYTKVLPYGTTVAPGISGTKVDATSSVGSVVDNTVNGEGTKTITVTAEDGNTKTYTVNFVVDTTHPTLLITGPDKLNVKEGEFIEYVVTYTGADDSTIDLIPYISGLGGNVTFSQTGTVTGSIITSISITDNEATIIVKVGSGDGTVGINILAGSAQNEYGSLTTPASSDTATVDNTAPTLSNVVIKSNNTNSAYAAEGDTITLTFTASEALAANPTVTIAGNTASVSKVGNDYTATYVVTSVTTEGTVAFSISGYKDTAGNTGSTVTSGTGSATVDITAPVISSPASNGAMLYTAITPSWTETNFSYATLKKDSGSHEAYTSGTEIEDDGDYVLTVYDLAGNSTARTFTIDKNGPAVTGISVKKLPDLVIYDYGVTAETIDLTGLELDVTYEEGAPDVVKFDDGAVITVTDVEDGIGTIQVEIVYRGETTTFNITVKDTFEIVITGPDTTSYTWGQALDTDGITITKVWAYAGEEEIDIELDPGVSITVESALGAIGSISALEVADVKVVVSYSEDSIVLESQDYAITVTDPITHITAALVDGKSIYKYGEELEIEVTAHHLSTATSTISTGYTTDYDPENIGDGQTITIEYGTLTPVTVTVSVKNYVTDIEIVNYPKLVYNISTIAVPQVLSLTGGEFIEIWANGDEGLPKTITTVNHSSYDLETVGSYNVEVIHEIIGNPIDTDTFSTYYTIVVINPASSINISAAPRTDYDYGAAFDYSTGSITITRVYGTEGPIPLTDPRISITGFDATPAGFSEFVTQVSGTVRITFKETLAGVVFTDFIDCGVEIHDVKGIEIKVPSKLTYIKGESLDLTDGMVWEKWASGTITNERVMLATDVSGYNANKLGQQDITVTYAGKTKVFTVTVTNNVTGIAMNTIPNKTSYLTGNSLDVTGGTIKVKRQNGEEEIITITSDMISGYDKDKVGNQVVKVTYEGYEVEFTVTVEKRTVIGATTIEGTTSDEALVNDGETSGIGPVEIQVETNSGLSESDATGKDKTARDSGVAAITAKVAKGGNIHSILIGLFLLLALLTAAVLGRKNVLIYNEAEELIGKERITGNKTTLDLNKYNGDKYGENFEIILKKSISKKLNNKKVVIEMNGKQIDYKINYKYTDCKIALNKE